MSLGTRVKDFAAEIFVIAERLGVFRKLPAFERDLSEYPELSPLVANYATVRRECEALVNGSVRLPHMSDLMEYTAGGVHQIQWKTFMFKSGDFIAENCALAPGTAALLRDIPGIYTAFFSVLEPHQHITPHWGYWKGFVRYHLGVIIPNDNRDKKCWLRINPDAQDRFGDSKAIEQGETYYWSNGEAVLFDDTFLHDAANDSEQVRVVLFLDLARKMPWPLSWLNKFFLDLGHSTKAVRQVRKNAAVKAAA